MSSAQKALALSPFIHKGLPNGDDITSCQLDDPLGYTWMKAVLHLSNKT